MQQARNIRDAIEPQEVLFVIDAMIGQDAVNTANAFNEGVDFTGVVLSKLDGDARGGAALSVASVTGKPIMFASTGENVDDFEQFHPDRMASRILDMGDVLTLIEQAEATWDKAEADRMAKKFIDQEDFTFDDFLAQMQQIRKLGSMKKLLMMMPGAAQMRQQLESFDEREIDRVEAIVRSMTPHERVAPKIINGSRRARIAKGSGVTVSEVNQLMERFAQAQKMMKKLATGKMSGMPGGMQMPGMAAAGGSNRKKNKKNNNKKKAGRSGNPMKRKQQEAEALAAQKARQGAAFGQQAQQQEDLDLSKMNLPKGFEKFLQ